jgi:hypothetical protein
MDLIREKDFPNNYSQTVVEVLDSLSMTGLKGLKLVGSSAIRSQQYAGDYDAGETVRAETIQLVVDKLQDIIKGRLSNVYFGDIKIGEVKEWDVFQPDARVEDGKVVDFNIVDSKSRVDELKGGGVITTKEAEDANALLDKATTPFGFLEARKTIRFHILRWKPADILEGALLYRGEVFRIEDALQTGGLVKLDAIADVNDRFVEFSVIYNIFVNRKKITPSPPNLAQSVQEDITYYSKTNPFKAIKRTFTLAKFFKNEAALKALLPILNSDLGRLYQIVGDIGTLVDMLGRPSSPLKRIKDAMDELKARLGTIYSLKDVLREEHSILGDINALVKMTNTKTIKMRLERIKDRLQRNLDTNTLKQVKDTKNKVSFEQ